MGKCCQGCARWVIGTVSICVIVCCVIAAVVVYKREKDKDWSKLIKNNVAFIFILVAMAFAVFSALIGFLLCCCKKRCLYYTYLIIIVVVIIIEIVAIILAFVYKDNIINGINDNWTKGEYNETRKDIEGHYKCCGFYHTYDDNDVRCGYVPKSNETVIEPCYEQIKKEIDSNMKSLRVAVIIMAVVEVVLLGCAIYLVCSSNKSDDGIAKF